MIQFEMPKNQSSILKVIGVGGGGSNAVSYMYSQDIEGVNFIVCNTDAQALQASDVPNKIQLGPNLTQGLGAGANPQVGKDATEESLDEIKKILEVNTKMAFITAGMGGGTGTGGAPIIAKICKELNILTVGIVTMPFSFEGKKRLSYAQKGIEELKQTVDTLLVISNDKLRHQYGDLKMKDAFNKADNILSTAARCITDVINGRGQINVDFADVCTVMRNGGVAILGSAKAQGTNRAQLAVTEALSSPLLNDNEIKGAKWILININSASGEHEFTMDEVDMIQDVILSQAGEDTDVILGLGYDDNLQNEISVTLIATGFNHKDPFTGEQTIREDKKAANEKIVMNLEMASPETTAQNVFQIAMNFDDQRTNIVAASEPTESEQKMQQQNLTIEVESDNTSVPAPKIIDPINVLNNEPNSPVIQFDFETVAQPIIQAFTPVTHLENNGVEDEKTEVQQTKEAVPAVAQSVMSKPIGLTKPKNIYSNDSAPSTQAFDKVQETEIQQPDVPLVQSNFTLEIPEDEAIIEMQLIEKTENFVSEVSQTEVINEEISSSPNNEKLTSHEALTDSDSITNHQWAKPSEKTTENDKSKVSERIAKLRNLSYSHTDIHSDLEYVPAYLRRKTELKADLTDIESFYSSYTVKPNNDKVEISTINTFLEGNKPD